MRGVRWTHSYYQRVLKLHQSAISVKQDRDTHVLNFLWFMDIIFHVKHKVILELCYYV